MDTNKKSADLKGEMYFITPYEIKEVLESPTSEAIEDLAYRILDDQTSLLEVTEANERQLLNEVVVALMQFSTEEILSRDKLVSEIKRFIFEIDSAIGAGDNIGSIQSQTTDRWTGTVGAGSL